MAQPIECDTAPVTVEAETREVAMQICRAVERAVATLATCDIALKEPVLIETATDLPENCMGVFHCGEARIEILPPSIMAKALREESIFVELDAEVYFDSIIVHELAHAAFDAVPCPFNSCIATAEYVAFTFQMLSLSEADRRKVEARSDVPSQISSTGINAGILMMDPDRFASRAWRHFRERKDSCGYMDRIMAGDVRFDSGGF